MAACLLSVRFGCVRLLVSTLLHVLSEGPSQELKLIFLVLGFFTSPWCKAGAVVTSGIMRKCSLGKAEERIQR